MLKELFFAIITFFNPSFGVQQIHVQPIENTSSTSDKQTVGTLDDAIVQANEALKDKDVEIYLEGNIKLTKPIKIENKTNHKLTIKNGTIDGSKQLTNQWTNTGNDIYTYTFPANEKPVSIPILYIDNQEQKPASKDLCTYDKVIPMKDAIIESVTGSLASSANEIHSMWVTQQWSFTESRYTIGKINNNKIYLSEDAKKALVGYKYPTYHLQNKNNTKYLWYTAYNSSAFIQNDKDFSYNRDTGVLTLKSAKNPSSRKIEIPATDSLIEVVNANNVHFDNVTFTKTANTNDVYNCFRSVQGDAGVNQVQAKVNRPSIININEANNITFDKCKFEKLNNTVVAMDNRVFNSTITNSTFTDIGGSAVRIGPEVKGDQLSRDNNPLANLDKTATEIPQGVWQYPQNITIDQNSFNNIGTNYKGSIGVFVEYGNNVKVDHNTFDKTSYSAISVGWGWHNRNSTQAITNKNGNIQVTNNFITNAMTETVDGAPIYHLGYAGEKDIISGNYINTNKKDRK